MRSNLNEQDWISKQYIYSKYISSSFLGSSKFAEFIHISEEGRSRLLHRHYCSGLKVSNSAPRVAYIRCRLRDRYIFLNINVLHIYSLYGYASFSSRTVQMIRTEGISVRVVRMLPELVCVFLVERVCVKLDVFSQDLMNFLM
jgi:hypothetical protein